MRAHRNIAHQHIHRPQRGDSLGHHVGNSLRVRNIADDSMSPYAQLPALAGHRFKLIGRLARVQNQIGSFPGKRPGDLGADVAAGAG